MKPRGFTLIEVLIAMAIMAIIAIMAWRGVDSIVRSRQITADKVEKLLRLNTTLAQWEQDLHHLQNTEKKALEPITFDGRTLTLVRHVPQGLQIVTWSLREGAWQRWASPAVTTPTELLMQRKASQQFLGNEPGQLTTVRGLSAWQVYFFRDNAWTNAQSSAGTPSPGAPELQPPPPSASSAFLGATPPRPSAPITVPKGVRLVLTFAAESGYNGTVTRDIQILGSES